MDNVFQQNIRWNRWVSLLLGLQLLDPLRDINKSNNPKKQEILLTNRKKEEKIQKIVAELPFFPKLPLDCDINV